MEAREGSEKEGEMDLEPSFNMIMLFFQKKD